jgi:hypothetical protein
MVVTMMLTEFFVGLATMVLVVAVIMLTIVIIMEQTVLNREIIKLVCRDLVLLKVLILSLVIVREIVMVLPVLLVKFIKGRNVTLLAHVMIAAMVV